MSSHTMRLREVAELLGATWPQSKILFNDCGIVIPWRQRDRQSLGKKGIDWHLQDLVMLYSWDDWARWMETGVAEE